MKTTSIFAIILSTVYFSSLFASDEKPSTIPSKQNAETLAVTDVEWSPLNPARGDASPRAANLWGDRSSSGAAGFLVKFHDGFSSPPHIHNVSYRGIVISGLLHNHHQDNKVMWMPPSSFWTQPAGAEHITAAVGKNNIAYIEIDNGPYLVHPAKDNFDNHEKPINVDKSNLVWLDASDISWLPAPERNIQISFLWGKRSKGQPNGMLLKIPAGVTLDVQSETPTFHAVVIQGTVKLPQTNSTMLMPGSYFRLEEQSIESISSTKNEDSIIYIRSDGEFRLALKQDS